MVVGADLEISHQKGVPTNLLQRPAAAVAETWFFTARPKGKLLVLKHLSVLVPSPGPKGAGCPAHSILNSASNSNQTINYGTIPVRGSGMVIECWSGSRRVNKQKQHG